METATAAANRTAAEKTRPYYVQMPIVLKHLDWAVKESVRFNDCSAFAAYLRQDLPFRAANTRQRAATMISQLFPQRSLDILPARTWRAYKDGRLVKDLTAAAWLSVVPPDVGRFVTIWLAQMEPGAPVTKDVREGFLAAEPMVHDPKERLFMTMWYLGFLRQLKPGRYVVAERQMSPTAFWLMLLDRYAPEPATVGVATLLTDPFWRYLGGRQEREVREALAAAERAGLLRHERVDQLDQVATRLSLAETLDRRVRL